MNDELHLVFQDTGFPFCIHHSAFIVPDITPGKKPVSRLPRPDMSGAASNVRPAPDKVLIQIAEYVDRYAIRSKLALETSRLTLIDTLGCGFEALAYPACTKLLGPVVPGTIVPNGARVPGTSLVLTRSAPRSTPARFSVGSTSMTLSMGRP